MSLPCKIGGQLAAVFSDASGFGVEVEAEEEEAHEVLISHFLLEQKISLDSHPLFIIIKIVDARKNKIMFSQK